MQNYTVRKYFMYKIRKSILRHLFNIFFSFPQSHIPPKGENKCVRTHKEKNHITLQGNQNGGENLLLVINFQCKNP